MHCSVFSAFFLCEPKQITWHRKVNKSEEKPCLIMKHSFAARRRTFIIASVHETWLSVQLRFLHEHSFVTAMMLACPKRWLLTIATKCLRIDTTPRYIWYIWRFGCWLCFHLQVIACHYRVFRRPVGGQIPTLSGLLVDQVTALLDRGFVNSSASWGGK